MKFNPAILMQGKRFDKSHLVIKVSGFSLSNTDGSSPPLCPFFMIFSLKSFANHLEEKTKREAADMLSAAEIEAFQPKKVVKDEYLQERFWEYCYMSFPGKRTNDYYMNDIYYYSALLYSIFTGRCFVKDFDSSKETEVRKAVEKEETAEWLIAVFYRNLGEQILPERMVTIKEIVIKLLETV